MDKLLGVSDAFPSKAARRVQPIEVLVADETDSAVDGDRLQDAVRAALSDSPFSHGSISVAIVDDPTIHQLNRQFLQHDYATDVLSFALEDQPPRLEGEIVVSIDTARRCAAEAGWPADDELLLYVIHGALHLAGHRDKQSAAAEAMRAREATILDELGVQRSPSDPRWNGAADADQETSVP